jgi:hypothetical protein
MMKQIFQSRTRSRSDGELDVSKHHISFELTLDEDTRSVDTSSSSCSLVLETKDNECSNKTIVSALKSSKCPSTELPCAQQKNVRFSSIEIREYPGCLGDNPAVSAGVPITIEWEHQCEYELNVQDYEAARPPRRNKFQMRIGPLDRTLILKSSGYSRQEIKARIKETDIARHQRQRTGELLLLAPLQESLERIQKAAANATIRRAAKRQERALLAEYVRPPKVGMARNILSTLAA